jgi:ParB-like chromosome segregation protein Spo0J
MTIRTVGKIESRKIENVKPYEKNSKLHDPVQIDKLAAIIKEHGFDVPIVVDENGVIIKGHGRRLAALKLGMTRVPVIVRVDMSEEEKTAARIADNVVARGELDEEALLSELSKLSAGGSDLSLLGFGDDELSGYLGQITALDPSALLNELDALDLDSRPAITSQPTIQPKSAPQSTDYKPAYQVVVECRDESDQRAVYDEMAQKGYACRVLTI